LPGRRYDNFTRNDVTGNDLLNDNSEEDANNHASLGSLEN